MQLFIYYKTLELDRDRELKLNARNFDASMCISTEWIRLLNRESRPISRNLIVYLLLLCNFDVL